MQTCKLGRLKHSEVGMQEVAVAPLHESADLLHPKSQLEVDPTTTMRIDGPK